MPTTKEKPTMPVSITIKGDKLPSDLLRQMDATTEHIFTITPQSLKTKDKSKKNKWAEIAEKISQESPLEGASEELIKASKMFREGFTLKEFEFSNNE